FHFTIRCISLHCTPPEFVSAGVWVKCNATKRTRRPGRPVPLVGPPKKTPRRRARFPPPLDVAAPRDRLPWYPPHTLTPRPTRRPPPHGLRLMPRRFRFLPVAALAFALPAAAATPDAHPVVPGFERFYTAANADAATGGQLLLGELNCVSCHAPKDAALGRKQAPVLDTVAARVRVGFLRQFLADPHRAKPGTTMPDLFAGDPERDRKVEALVHFLASTGHLKQERP